MHVAAMRSSNAGALNPHPHPAPLTESTNSFLLDSPMLFRATSTSFCPGRQLTQLLRECETALATCAHSRRQGP